MVLTYGTYLPVPCHDIVTTFQPIPVGSRYYDITLMILFDDTLQTSRVLFISIVSESCTFLNHNPQINRRTSSSLVEIPNTFMYLSREYLCCYTEPRARSYLLARHGTLQTSLFISIVSESCIFFNHKPSSSLVLDAITLSHSNIIKLKGPQTS